MTFFARIRTSFRVLENVRVLTVVALLTALQVILSMLNINITASIRFSLGFLMVAVCGMLYGPTAAGLQAVIADLLTTFLFPQGAYFPGLTLSALLGGVLYGLVLYKKPWTWQRMLLAKGLVNVLLNIGLNTYWISVIQGKSMWVLLWPRVVKNLAWLPVEVLLLVMVAQVLRRISSRIPGNT